MKFDGIFKGGGALGSAYLGAVEHLYRNGHWFAGVAGTSAGSIAPWHAAPSCTRMLQLLADGVRGAGSRPAACGSNRLPVDVSEILRVAGNPTITMVFPPPAAALAPTLRGLFPASVATVTTPVPVPAPAGGSWASYVIPVPGTPGVTVDIWVPPGAPLPLGSTASAGPVLIGAVRVDFQLGELLQHVLTLVLDDGLDRLILANPKVGAVDSRKLLFVLESFGELKSNRFHAWINRAIVNGLVRRYANSVVPFGQFPETHPVPSSSPAPRLRDLTQEQRDGWHRTKPTSASTCSRAPACAKCSSHGATCASASCSSDFGTTVARRSLHAVA